ncbi:peptidylprolyl isomerase [Motiliproteus sp. MSK22-1]|uniref:FKBP-type peptidyl-prolyl cis-trans isomerase n=1 Tax=Motiliproteus sp. MSK22-1 TaxID=1897630 RepID=UPI0009787E8B|nr:peptidylprolyl isomerase [Motiliproteus sp. MSK22-1]OMH28404.1 peptidylprolyl isomerase [Motiliproteus sp. MSK22-1]
MSEQVIGPGKTVTLHFAIKLEDGEVVDSTFDKSPATFSVGDGNLLKGFELALHGLKPGDESTLRIVPEQAFGMPNPNNVQVISRDRFKDLELEPGLMIAFADAGQSELPGMVKSFDEQQVTVDFNHPLAGRTLYFDVNILDVETA